MNGYIISVAGVVFISVVIDIIIPNGKMEKYVKAMISLVVVFVMLCPLPNLISSMKNGSFGKGDFVDDDFISKINSAKNLTTENALISVLQKAGVEGCKVEVITDLSTASNQILFVYVDISSAVLKGELGNINTNDLVCEVIMGETNLDKEAVFVYGGS